MSPSIHLLLWTHSPGRQLLQSFPERVGTQTHCPVLLSHTDPATVPLSSQIQGRQPRDDPSDRTQNNVIRKQNRATKPSLLHNNTKAFYFNDSNRAASQLTLLVKSHLATFLDSVDLNWKTGAKRGCDFSYSGCLSSGCSSFGHSWYTVLPPPLLCMGIVRSTRRTHPPARCRGCRTHTADSPGSSAAPGCGNRDDRSHSHGLPRVPEKERDDIKRFV